MGTIVKQNGNQISEKSIFDDFFPTDFFQMNRRPNYSTPAVNVKETDHAFEIELATPGMKKEDFNIELDNKVLTISAQRSDSEETKEGNYTRREFNFQSFKRSFSLSDKLIDRNDINASYENGILRVRIGKTEEAKVQPSRRIDVQ